MHRRNGLAALISVPTCPMRPPRFSAGRPGGTLGGGAPAHRHAFASHRHRRHMACPGDGAGAALPGGDHPCRRGAARRAPALRPRRRRRGCGRRDVARRRRCACRVVPTCRRASTAWTSSTPPHQGARSTTPSTSPSPALQSPRTSRCWRSVAVTRCSTSPSAARCISTSRTSSASVPPPGTTTTTTISTSSPARGRRWRWARHTLAGTASTTRRSTAWEPDWSSRPGRRRHRRRRARRSLGCRRAVAPEDTAGRRPGAAGAVRRLRRRGPPGRRQPVIGAPPVAERSRPR